MIDRQVKQLIVERLFKGKVIILLGPRQVGKTTLLNQLLSQWNDRLLNLNADDPIVLKLLDRPNTAQIRQIIGNNSIVFIDEAQRINEIGLTSKIIVDQFNSIQLILSGSSAFELSQQTHEPLTGRKWTFKLWPVSWQEWEGHIGFVGAEQDLDNRLVFGFYPEVLMNPADANRILFELTESYLYKDILMYANIKRPLEIQKLLQALAYQVGNEVSYRELSELVGIDPKTIDKYIDVLEKAYVVFRLNPLSRNLRNEIKSNRKIYFYDNGIRNALIGQLQPLSTRNDVGQLWENFLISERMKKIAYSSTIVNSYFWRTIRQQEIDYVEEIDGHFYAYEFKWNIRKKPTFPKPFLDFYGTENKVINRDNFREFLNL